MIASHDIKMEVDDEGGAQETIVSRDGAVTLDSTMEYCRNIGVINFLVVWCGNFSTYCEYSGEIPTYGLAGNRTDAIDVSDMKEEDEDGETAVKLVAFFTSNVIEGKCLTVCLK